MLSLFPKGRGLPNRYVRSSRSKGKPICILSRSNSCIILSVSSPETSGTPKTGRLLRHLYCSSSSFMFWAFSSTRSSLVLRLLTSPLSASIREPASSNDVKAHRRRRPDHLRMFGDQFAYKGGIRETSDYSLSMSLTCDTCSGDLVHDSDLTRTRLSLTTFPFTLRSRGNFGIYKSNNCYYQDRRSERKGSLYNVTHTI